MSIHVYWYTCIVKRTEKKVYCETENIDLEDKLIKGVEGNYIYWCPGRANEIAYVGLGIIDKAIKRHREKDDPVKKHYGTEELYFTYAVVADKNQKGVEHYLGDLLKPEVGEKWSGNEPKIEINLPDWAPFDEF